MKSLYCLVLFVILLTACESIPTGEALQTAMAQPTKTFIFNTTAIPTPTTILTSSMPTPTLIPLSDLYLEEILLLPGDLPTDFVGKRIDYNSLLNHFQGIPLPDQAIQQRINTGGITNSDGTGIFLYDSISDLDEAYGLVNGVITSLGTSQPLSNIGDKGDITEGTNALLGHLVAIVYTRCHSLVYISLFGPTVSTDIVTNYAQRLDERLTPLVCR
jgi:hypothetical protein